VNLQTALYFYQECLYVKISVKLEAAIFLLKCVKTQLQQSRISKLSRGKTPGPPFMGVPLRGCGPPSSFSLIPTLIISISIIAVVRK